MTFDSENFVPPAASIKVIGIGGGGGNAVNTMIRTNIEGVDFIVANTDVQALRFSLAEKKIQIGKELTKGLGAGADPDIGRDAMLEDRHAIAEALDGAQMVFITAGMGGGTGTGGAGIVAQIARELGALTVGVVTKPFAFEGRRRKMHADEGINRLRGQVDTLITIPNQRLLQIASPDLSMIDAFRFADNVLVNAVKGISDIINIPGTVNVDFADVKTVMHGMGMALMGIGTADGQNRAVEAARSAISSPLLEDVDIEGATGILINITAGENVSLLEVNEACSIIQEAAHDDANIIFGAVIDENVGEQMRVTVIATGFPAEEDLSDNFSLEDFNERERERRSQIPSQPEPFRVQPTPRRQLSADHRETGASSTIDQASTADASRSDVSGSPEEDAFMSGNRMEQTFTDPEASFHPNEETDEPPRVVGATINAESDHGYEFRGERSESLENSSPESESNASNSNQKETQGQEQDMDRKIDEALKIAEQIAREPRKGDDDDLDVPSFLRNDDKDMSLS
jgi:cell division protein FtsZ